MINIMLFLAIVFFLTLIIGKLIEKIRIPWIFSALLVGLGLAVYNPFKEITNSETFSFLAQLGMYFLLFIIGFELDLSQIKKQGKFIFSLTFMIILSETILGSILIHYLFSESWFVSVLVATSFSTIGEAVLLPILDEFKLTHTRLGQTILGVGVLDDVVEVLTIIVASLVVGKVVGNANLQLGFNMFYLFLLLILTIILIKMHSEFQKFKFKDIPSLFIFLLFIMFLFIGIGMFVESAALGAILAGIALKNIIPKNKLKLIDSEIKTMSYGFFAPLFFLSVGLDTDVSYLILYPGMILIILLMTNFTKIIMSYIMARKKLGSKKSIILGISLTVKMSTSIVVIKFLYDNSIINSNLYSVLIGTTIMFKFIVPMLLSYLITKWGISKVVKGTSKSV